MSFTWRYGMPAVPSRAGVGRLRSACEHLLYRLPGNAEFTPDVCLGEPVPDELPDQVAALGREQPRLPHVLERLGPDLPQPVERLLMVGDLSRHASIVTTPCCQCQRGLSRPALAQAPTTTAPRTSTTTTRCGWPVRRCPASALPLVLLVSAPGARLGH